MPIHLFVKWPVFTIYIVIFLCYCILCEISCSQAEVDDDTSGNVACNMSNDGHHVVDSSMLSVRQVSYFIKALWNILFTFYLDKIRVIKGLLKEWLFAV